MKYLYENEYIEDKSLKKCVKKISSLHPYFERKL